MEIYWVMPLLVLWLLAIVTTIVGTWYSLKKITAVPKDLCDFPPISVLKPLKGSDQGLSTNIESFFHLDYPKFELIFSVGDEKDPAKKIAEQLIALYPEVTASLIIGDVRTGVNPKINNLVRSYEKANYDAILISDSNVRVAPRYLQRLAPHLTKDVGIVTSIVAGKNTSNLGGFLEAMYLNTFYARWMHVSSALGFPTVVGKSMYFKKSTAERFGGIRTLNCYIAEDYMAGHAMKFLGLKVVIMNDPIPQYIGKYAFKEFWHRHIRWGRIRKSMAPLAFIAEPLMGSIVSGFIGALGFYLWLKVSPIEFFLSHLLVWFFCDLLLMVRLGEFRIYDFIIWLLRELFGVPLWLHTLCGNTVKWRGSKYTLLAGGVL